MHKVFAPVVILASRINHRQKTILIGLLGLICLVWLVLLFWLATDNSVERWLAGGLVLTSLITAYLLVGFYLSALSQLIGLTRSLKTSNLAVLHTPNALSEEATFPQILQWLKDMSQNLTENERQLQQQQNLQVVTSNKVLEVAKELVVDVSAQARGSNQQNVLMGEVNFSVNELATAAATIAELAVKVAETANLTAQDSTRIADVTANATNQSTQGLEAVERTYEVGLQVADFFQQLVNTLTDLELKSTRMQRILELLDEIASELHLLSLNAAIEAAGVGIEGARFGVVADEVRNLSTRSVKSNQEVGQIIQEVRNLVSATTTATNVVQQKIQLMGQVTTQAGSVIQDLRLISEQSFQQATSISQSAQRVKQLTQIINEATHIQGISSQQVQTNLKGLTEIVQANAKESSSLFTSTTVLQELTYNLHSLLANDAPSFDVTQLAPPVKRVTTLKATRPLASTNTFRFAQSIEPLTLDPMLATDKESAEIIDQLFDGLTQFDAELNVQPAIAASWHISEDGLKITYNLRSNARFSNGEPITAHDFIYSWCRVIFSQTATEAYLFEDILGVSEIRRHSDTVAPNNGVKGLYASDDYTLQVTLVRAAVDFLAKSTLPPYKVVHKASMERYDFSQIEPQNFVSSGAFVLKEWQKEKFLLLKLNPYYWESQVQVETIKVEIIKDEHQVRTKYDNDELDFIEVSALDLIQIYEDPLLKNQLKIIPRSRANFICFNHQQGPFADNLELRKAFYHSIDRRALVDKALHRAGIPLHTLLVPGLPTYEFYDAHPFNPELAKASLKAAGYDTPEKTKQLEDLINNYGEDGRCGGFAYTSERANWQEASENYVQQIREHLGLNLKLNPIPTYQEFEQRRSRKREFLLYFGSWGTDYPDPANFYLPLFGSQNRTQMGGGYFNPQFDEFCLSGAVETDLSKRAWFYQQAEKLLQDDAAFIPTYCSVYLLLIKPYISNWMYSPMGLMLLKWVQLRRD